MQDIDITEYEALVKSIVGKYLNKGLAFEDLFQEGMIGLMEAKKRFKKEKDVKFSTYSTYWIKKKILAALDKEYKNKADAQYNDDIFLSSKKKKDESTLELPKALPQEEKRVLWCLYQKEMTLKEISKELKVRRERVRQIKQKALRRLKALNFNSILEKLEDK